MNKYSQLSFVAALALLVSSCASSSVLKSWKSPAHLDGPVQKVAVLTVEERSLVRQGFENRFVTELTKAGQPSLTTFQLFSLAQAKANKEAAGAQLREAGADAILIVRLQNLVNNARQVRESTAYVPVTTDFGSDGFGWYDYYTVAYADMSVIRSSLKQTMYLESSLFDLKTGKLLWSGLSETKVDYESDRLAELEPLIAKIAAAMRQDGMIR